MSERPEARFVKPGEILAIYSGSLMSGPKGFFWLFGGGTKANERRGNVAIVSIRDGLEHHSDSWADNYESILARVEGAMTGQDVVDADAAKHRWEDDYVPLTAEKPSCVVLDIDSPGGVVSGLNETVAKLIELKKKHGVKLIAVANEMIASAAMALACSADRIYAPKSAIVGSIGVISTMYSQSERDKDEGLDVRLITSGARKADGHPHAPISDDAISVERKRVEKLAAAFYSIVRVSRGLSVDKIRSFEAGIFLGTEAKRKGLIDDIKSLDDVVRDLTVTPPRERLEGNETDRRAKLCLTGHTLARHTMAHAQARFLRR